MAQPVRYAANCSMLFTEEPLLRRPAAARAAGFDAVEFWWPFATATPGSDEVDAFVAAVRDAGTALIGLNLYAGDMPAGERGVLSRPDAVDAFRAGVAVAADIAERTGVRTFNALYGQRVEGVDPAEQDRVALANLVHAARELGRLGGRLVIEPLSGVPGYPVRTYADADAVCRRVRAAGAENIGVLADLYHLAANGEDVAELVAAHAARFAHVQIADHPGRHEPGTGALDLPALIGACVRGGYDGPIALEYAPSAGTTASLAWLGAFERR